MNALLRRLVDSRSPGSLAASLRRRRFARFLELIEGCKRPVSILDVGGDEGFWRSMGLAGDMDYRITLLNRYEARTRSENCESLVGDATSMPELGDREFDAVFSNSVIEHVGDFEAQRAMAREIQRVGKSYFVQTPNRYFPIEPHFLVPLFQFLPVPLRVALVRRFDLGWYRRIPDAAGARRHVLAHRLLCAAEMRQLFPCAALEREKLCGLTKSLIAWGHVREPGGAR
jgi:hypothetical protein